MKAVSLEGADLTAANVAGARFEGTVVTGATLRDLVGVEEAEITSIVTDEGRLDGDDAREWLYRRSAAPTP